MVRSFFQPTTDFRRQHAELFDFVHGTAAALWNMRWQVQGYLIVVPNAPEAELKGRFVVGSGIDRTLDRANVKQSFVRTSWSRQQDELASIALLNLVARYEGWLEDVVAHFGLSSTQARARVKELQFPSDPSGTSTPGAADALAALKKRSPFMENVFGPVLRANEKYDLASLNSLMHIYRYFKEVRNSIVHRGGRANTTTEDAWAAMDVLSPAVLSVSVPNHRQPTAGQVIRPSLMGVFGFGEVLLRIVVTVDAELALSPVGEAEFVSRWRRSQGRKTVTRTQPKRDRRLLSLVRVTDLPAPRPSAVRALDEFLKREHLIS